MKTEVKASPKNNIKKNNSKKINKKNNKKPVGKKKINYKKRRAIAACIVLLIISAIISSILLFSNLFNIKKITVINNSKIMEQEIIQASGLTLESNMFRSCNSKIKKRIKTNPYVEDVKITKKLNGEVILDIEERKTTYMLQHENEYVYINNQGYILEVSQEQLPLPIIKGYSTAELTPGQRLEEEDLEKLDIVIQIIEAAKSNGINEIITAVDISNIKNILLEIPSENKIVEFGDETNIYVKILWILKLIEKEKGVAGRIVLNVPNIKKVYFRENV